MVTTIIDLRPLKRGCKVDTKEMKKLTEIIGVILTVLAVITAPIFYLYALWIDCKHDHFAMFAADLLVPPIGMIHGLILLIWGP